MLHAPCALLKLLFGFLDRHPFLLIKPQVKRDLQVTRTCLFLVNVIISEDSAKKREYRSRGYLSIIQELLQRLIIVILKSYSSTDVVGLIVGNNEIQ